MSAMPQNKKAIWAWALYDFANSPFTTLVVTFIYATYFTKVIADNEIQGTSLWSLGVIITAITVALLSPLMGALADRGGFRKAFLLLFTAVCIIGTWGLYYVKPGQLYLALAIFVTANICFELANVFYNAFLPDIAPRDRIGRISGYGWGLGYAGGLVALVLALFLLVQPQTPWFGFTTENGENIRATNLLVAIWFAVFSLPLLIWVKDSVTTAEPTTKLLRDSIGQLRQTFKEIAAYRQTVRFLIARLVYNDGVVTIFAFGGIYAAGTFGFSFEEILLFGIALNIAAGLGAFAMGFLDDYLGGKRTIQFSLIGLLLASLLAVLADDKALFWLAGIVVGIFSGPVQSASRSLMGRFVPAAKVNEFFGFFAFSGKATAFIGPLMLGVLTDWSGSQRVGVAIVVVLFVVGFVLLLRVDEAEGVAQARH